MTTPYEISTPPIPVGTISYYIKNGSTTSGTNSADPNGWVICDGQPRDASDGRYAALAPLLDTYLTTTGNTGTRITPPDYRVKFLYGQASTGNNTISNGGTTTLVDANIPSFDVDLEETPHSHSFNIYRTPGTAAKIGPAAARDDDNTVAYDTSENFTNLTLQYDNPNQTPLPDPLPDPPKANVTYIIKY